MNLLDKIMILAPKLLKGVLVTIEITSVAVLAGVIIGLIMALCKMSKKKILKIPAIMYIEAIRGTPILVQILLFYFGLPQILSSIFNMKVTFTAIVAGMIVCSINSGAYVAEIFRAGIQSIDKGQMEAARSLGLSHTQAMRYIILPQAFKRVLPPLGNEFIVLLKETSILTVIGVQELTGRGRLHVSATFDSFFTYTGVAITYLILTLSISRLVTMMERRLGTSDRS
ncbi:MAG: amino acid ABC transporter permease [Clostridia bacterium]|nr:amino acid ABC transporter permease [Clostridia bacterium]